MYYCTKKTVVISIFTLLTIIYCANIGIVNLSSHGSPSVVLNLHERHGNYKYMLLWTKPNTEPFVWLGDGRQGFIDRKCPVNNCFVTADRSLLGAFHAFDAVLFAGPEVVRYTRAMLPTERYPHQKFIFASLESPSNYPIRTNILNGFFNWTWTYKLNSDASWGYIAIRDKRGNVIGPSIEMHWLKQEDMDPVGDELAEQLSTKSRVAAWFVSNCNPTYNPSKRGDYVEKLQEELSVYNLTVDVYGRCGPLECGRGAECAELIERDYYFYLSFENSFSEDYVTEKLVRPLKHNAVPIVYGGANYSRFMPPSMYLDARKLGARTLAKKMYELMNDRGSYLEYFRWKSHYSYHAPEEAVDTDEYCKFCEILNNATLMKTSTVYEDMRSWWAPHDSI